MKKILIERLNLSARAQNVLHKMHICYVDELLTTPLDEISSQKYIGIKTINEIDSAIKHVKKGDIELIKDSIFGLHLSAHAQRALKKLNINSIEKLLSMSLDDFSNQRNVGEKTVNEIKETILQIKRDLNQSNVMKTSSQTRIFFSYEQMNELSCHTISELGLSQRSYNCLIAEGYDTLDSVALLSKFNLRQINNLGEKSADEISLALKNWFAANDWPEGVVDTESGQLTVKGNSQDDEYENAIKILSSAFEPAIHIYWVKLYKWINDEGIKDQIDIRENTESLESNVRAVFNLPEIQNYIKAFWISFAPDGIIEKKTAKDSVGAIGFSFAHDLIIQESCKKNIILSVREYYLVRRSSFHDVFYSSAAVENRKYIIMKQRLEGKTLQEIADIFALTKESIRQILNKYIKSFQPILEDYFSEPFTYFSWSEGDFCRAFPEVSADGYEYLSIKYKKGKLEFNEDSLLEYDGLWKDTLLSFYEENKLLIYKNTVTRKKVVMQVLISNSNITFSFKKFENRYHEFLNQQEFPIKRLCINRRTTLDRCLRAVPGVVFNHENKFRYCSVDPNIIWKTIDFYAYKDSVISSELIYRDYRDLMDEMDIRDGYELFYILKSSMSLWEGDFKIFFRRIPVMILGVASEQEQALKLLKELSPVGSSEYFRTYEERFGIQKNTAQAKPVNYKVLKPFYDNGIYSLKNVVIDEDDIEPFH